MKLSKEELKKKIDEKIVDDELKIELLEDIEDSFEAPAEVQEDTEDYKAKYEELKEKYKARFLDSDSTAEKEEEKTEELEEVEEIDIKEI